MEQRKNLFMFVIFVGISFHASLIGFVDAIVTNICDDPLTKSYCLDCLTFAVCDIEGGYTPIGCPTGRACYESTPTTTSCSSTGVDGCRCSGTTYPVTNPDVYDGEDKAIICLSATNGPYIECKDGKIYNDMTATCESPIKSTAYPNTLVPLVKCNNKAEFICLGCDYYQVCLSDNTAQAYACDAGTLCNVPAKKCIPTTFACSIDGSDTAGFQIDPYDCTVYYYCDGVDPQPYTEKTCPEGEVFVVESQRCQVDPDGSSKCPTSYDCTTDVTSQLQITTNTPSSCPCSSTTKTCKIDCWSYYYCYEDPPGTYTPIEKVCPYDFIFNPTTELCESGTCVNWSKISHTNFQKFNPLFVIYN